MQNVAPTILNDSAPGRIEILLVGDSSAEEQRCQRTLQLAGFHVRLQTAQTAQEFRALASTKSFQLVLAEQTLAGWSGIEALNLLKQMEMDIPFILLTPIFPDEQTIELLRRSGADFVERDHLLRLPLAVGRALEQKHLRQELASVESQLHHSRKLESVGRLAAGVAHDFNNILTVIQCHVGLLRSEPNLRPEMGESLQQVSRATERACRLTSQLLHFSRKHPAQTQPLDLNEVLTTMSMLLHRTLGEDLSIQFSYDSELPSLQADRNLLEQLILDLAVNARGTMGGGGQLAISTASVNLDPEYVASHPEASSGQFVCLSMIDTGCGLEPGALAGLGAAGVGVANSSEAAPLGLAAVCGIVKQLQGWMEVQSQAGQGSTFKIFFPALKPGERIEKTAPMVRGGSETVLVVEDESPVLWTTRKILENYGYHVFEAASGVEALAIWHQRQKEIVLLLTDIVMPVGVSGQELAEQFLTQKPALKVIYTSGYSAEAAATNLELVPGINFLQKPYDAEALARVVRSRLDAPGLN